MADNAITNDTAIRVILTYFLLKLEDPDSRRVRYFSYIINLAAKAFLFGKDADAFDIKGKPRRISNINIKIAV
jgi:hypothetical protein